MNILSTIFIAAAAFAACNIGEMFILLTFFLDKRFTVREIITGQYIAAAGLIALCLVLGLTAFSIAPLWLHALGVLPIFIGIRNLFQLGAILKAEEEEEKRVVRHMGINTLSVAAVMFADGSDNIGVFAPLFAHSGVAQIPVIILVFLALIAVWCALAHYLMHHKHTGALIRKYGTIVAPLALIAVGIFILI